MPSLADRIAERREQRAARALVWREVFAAVQANPDADPEQIAADVAVNLEDQAEAAGMDIAVLLQLLVTILPLILQLFQRD
jgi:hypothetical protein